MSAENGVEPERLGGLEWSSGIGSTSHELYKQVLTGGWSMVCLQDTEISKATENISESI